MQNALKKLFLTSSLSVLASGQAIAFGSDDEWQSGYGQGVCEAVVTSGAGNQIYVACDCGSGMASSIRFSLAGQSAPGSRIFLTFDDKDPEPLWISDGQIGSDCRACAANFDHILDGLRESKKVHVMYTDGAAATFSLSGAADAIGECPAGFY